MNEPRSFRNRVGRFFAVGQFAVVYDEPIPGRSFACRITAAPTITPADPSGSLVAVEVFPPNAAKGLNVHAHADNLFPSFEAIARRQAFPTWFAVKLVDDFAAAVHLQQQPLFGAKAVGTACRFHGLATAIKVGEAFAVRCNLPDEHYETLDGWLLACDRFVDENALAGAERQHVETLRAYLQAERAEKLRNRQREGADR